MSRLFAGTPFDKPSNCSKCGQSTTNCRCLTLPDKKKMSAPKNPANRLDSGLVLTPQNSNPPADQVAKIRTEKRKGNRTITVITGLEHPANDLNALCTTLKQSLGIGGSIQSRTIELQGDNTKAIASFLQAQNFKTRIL